MTLLAALLAQVALGAVSQPFPGVTLVEEGSSALAVVELCAPGVALRATRYPERGATPEQWAVPLGLQLAVNADFFDLGVWSFVNGRARGAGEDWPAGAQYLESRSYWKFGPQLADLEADAAVPPPQGVSDIIGGHNLLILGGQSRGPVFDGDGVLQVAARRTAVGMSQDRRRLFLLATHEWLTGTELVALLFSLSSQAGGPGLDVATNVDGGGSTQLYVQGRGQVLSTGRRVANHLGVWASGSGPARNCNNRPAGGYLDGADAEAIAGWAWDPDDASRPVTVTLSSEGAELPVVAALHREDLCTALGSCAHGFRVPTPWSLADGAPHAVSAAALDLAGAGPAPLGGSPKQLQFSVTPSGVARPLPSDATLGSWGFSPFQDVLPPGVGSGLPPDAPWPSTPALYLLDGGALGLADTGLLRPISEEAERSWRLRRSEARGPAEGELQALRPGPPLRPRPQLVLLDGGLAMVDDPLPGEPPPAPSGPDAGSVPAPPGHGTASGVLGCAVAAGRGDAGWPSAAALAAAALGLGGSRRARRASPGSSRRAG